MTADPLDGALGASADPAAAGVPAASAPAGTCPSCGEPVGAADSFCESCGTELAGAEPARTA